MEITRTNVWLCGDCRIAAVNGDFTGLDNDPATADARYAAIVAGLEALGPGLVNDEGDGYEGYDEHSLEPCACCGERLHGSRHRFAILG